MFFSPPDAELLGASPHVVRFEFDRSGLSSRSDRVAGGMSSIRASKKVLKAAEKCEEEAAASQNLSERSGIDCFPLIRTMIKLLGYTEKS